MTFKNMIVTYTTTLAKSEKAFKCEQENNSSEHWSAFPYVWCNFSFQWSALLWEKTHEKCKRWNEIVQLLFSFFVFVSSQYIRTAVFTLLSSLEQQDFSCSREFPGNIFPFLAFAYLVCLNEIRLEASSEGNFTTQLYTTLRGFFDFLWSITFWWQFLARHTC